MKALYAFALVAAPLLGLAQGTTNAATVPADPKPLTAETLWKLGRVSLEAVSPDGSRFAYTITAAPGSQPTALSGSEVRVAP